VSSAVAFARAHADRFWPKLLERFPGDGLRASPEEDAVSELIRNEYAFYGAEIERPWAQRVFVAADDPEAGGFVHLRHCIPGVPTETELMEAHLTVPRVLRNGYHIIAHKRVYRLYGIGPARRTSPYIVPAEPFVARCGQAALQMVLMSLIPGGAVCLGGFDLTRIARGADGRTSHAGFRTDEIALQTGQLLNVLASEHTGVNGLLEVLDRGEDEPDSGAASDLLAGCLLSGCPVIMCVDAAELVKVVGSQLDLKDYEDRLKLAEEKPPHQRGHATVLVGCQTSKVGENREFVVHDSFTWPYMRIVGGDLLRLVHKWNGIILWIAAVPKGVRTSVCSIYRRLTGYLGGITHSSGQPVNLRPRLVPRARLVCDYLMGIGYKPDHDSRDAIIAFLRSLEVTHLWCFAVWERSGRLPISVHLYDASAADISLVGTLKGDDVLRLGREDAKPNEWRLVSL